MRGDPMYPPIPPDPEFGECEVEYKPQGEEHYTNCGEDAYEVVADTLMCQGHINDHHASEQADNARKGRQENE